MGKIIQLKATDGHSFLAYRAEPDGKPRGGIVVLQEIFGVNHHIRAVADFYAAQGYLAIAPALFDRQQQGVELGYEPEDRPLAFALAGKAKREEALADIAAAVVAASTAGKVGLVGYCWGGTLAFASACSVAGLSACVGYYGSGIAAISNQTPKAPVQLHFGELDAHIPMSDVEKIRVAHPKMQVYSYNADHGFNCDERASYNKAAAELARERALSFFAQFVG
jgi:carboxymethylenebutenolidase